METKNNHKIKVEGGFKTEKEAEVGKRISEIFNQSKDSLEVKLDNFPKYIRRQKLTRLLSLYEIFKQVLDVKGTFAVFLYHYLLHPFLASRIKPIFLSVYFPIVRVLFYVALLVFFSIFQSLFDKTIGRYIKNLPKKDYEIIP